MDDVVPRLTPYSKYYHTGGDEVNMKIYLLDEGVKSADPNVIRPYLERFFKHTHEVVRGNGALPVVWEEVITEWGIDLPKDVVVQVWLGDASVKNVTTQGYRTITGSYQFWVRHNLSRGREYSFASADNCSTWTAATDNGLTSMAMSFTHTMTGAPLRRAGA